MRQLSGARGWAYAYRKTLEDELAVKLEFMGEGVVEANLRYLQGEIHGIRVAISLLEKAQKDYRLDDDADFAS